MNKTLNIAHKKPLQGDVWALAASHIQAGLNTDVFQQETALSILNAAILARGYVNNLYTFKNLLEKSPKPQLLILGIAWMSFDKRYVATTLYPADFHFLSFEDKLDYLRRYIPQDCKKLFKMYSHRKTSVFYKSFSDLRERNQRTIKRWGKIHKRGFIESKTIFNRGDSVKIVKFFKKTFIAGRIKADQKKIRAFKEIIALAQSKGIKVVIVEPPEYYVWRKLEDRAQFRELLEPILRKYEVPYINFNLPSNLISYDNRNFIDKDHLNANGAKKWTKQLCDELKKRKLLPTPTKKGRI